MEVGQEGIWWVFSQSPEKFAWKMIWVKFFEGNFLVVIDWSLVLKRSVMSECLLNSS